MRATPRNCCVSIERHVLVSLSNVAIYIYMKYRLCCSDVLSAFFKLAPTVFH